MGRKTFESIGRPLPQRRNIILSQDPAFKAPGCAVAQDIPSAIALSQPAPEIMIIGGARIYAQFLPLADKIYLSVIHQPYEGDSFFPEIDPAAWNTILLETHPAFKIYTLYKRSL
jgi:dihydrofolate reductase